MTISPAAYINPLVEGRTPPANPQTPWTAQALYDNLYDGMMNRLYDRCLIHKPAGWIHTMSGGDWLGMTDEVRAVYTEVIGRVLAEKPSYQVSVYGGFQFYTAHSIYGRPRDDNGRFIAEPQWADADNPQHVRGIRELTVQPWADIGVTGWVFDSGSRDPREILRWRNRLRRVVDTVGLETIPWKGTHQDGSVDWWAASRGIECHGNQRIREGRPYLEVVPDYARGKAFVWLVHMTDPEPTPQEVADMMHRGWTPVVLWRNDALMAEAWDIYSA